MIRPDFTGIDAAVRASPAKVSAAMHYRIGSGSVLQTAPPPTAAAGTVSAWSASDGPMAGQLPPSRSCPRTPRTPTSVKKRKDSGSSAAALALALANPYSNVYRREMERKLLDGDHLLFEFKLPTTSVHSLAQVAPLDVPSCMSFVSPSPTSAPSSASARPFESFGTVTLGSLLGISALLLSTSTPRDLILSPGVSPHPSPAMVPFHAPPRSPLLAGHAINALSGHSSGSGLSNPSWGLHAPIMSLDEPASPTEPDSVQAKRPLTAQQWSAHQATNAIIGVPPILPSAILPQPTFTAPSPLQHPLSYSFARCGSNGALSIGSNESSCGSGVSSLLNSGFASAVESARGSFSNTTGLSLLGPDPLSSFSISSAADSMPPPPFVVRRCNSGPVGLARSTRDLALAQRGGMPEHGAPIAAFNVFGNRTMPQMHMHAQPPTVPQPQEDSVLSPLHVPHPVAARTPIASPFHSPLLQPQQPSQSPAHHSHSNSLHVPMHGGVHGHTTSPPPLPSSLPLPPVHSRQFNWLQTIGRGSFGEVYLVSRITAEQETAPEYYAIKKNIVPLTSATDRRSFLRRTEILKQLCDGFNNRRSPTGSPPQLPELSATAAYRWPPHLLRHHVVWQESSLLYTMTEYCALGDLFQFFRYGARMVERLASLQMATLAPATASDDDDMGVAPTSVPSVHSPFANGGQPSFSTMFTLSETEAITEVDLFQLIYQLSSILSVMHRQSILHNDIKPDNIYVCRNETAEGASSSDEAAHGNAPYPYVYKLGDLGSLVNLSEWTCDISEGDGAYLAPEALNVKHSADPVTHQRTTNLTAKIDIYALGASLYTLVTGEKFISQHQIAMPTNTTTTPMSDSPPVCARLLGMARPNTIATASPDCMSDCDQSEYTTPVGQGRRGHHHSNSFTGTEKIPPLVATERTLSFAPRSSGPMSVSSSHESLANCGFFGEAPAIVPSPAPVVECRDNEIVFDASRDVLPVSAHLRDLVQRMVSIHPHVRPTADELREWSARALHHASTSSPQL